MAKAKTKAADGMAEARGLVDLPDHGVTAGGLFTGPAEVVAALAAIGAVDPHPDAVDYARGQTPGSQID